MTFQHHPNGLPIESAPKDGSLIMLVRPDDGVLFEASWDPTGSSRNPDTNVLDIPGFWLCTDGGWFEVGEVHQWLPKTATADA